MKLKRRKNIRKILQFYKVNFDIREPYRVLVDGTFIQAALTQKINIKEQLLSIFNGKSVPVVSSCIVSELRGRGSEFLGSVVVAKHFYRHKCIHYDGDGISLERPSIERAPVKRPPVQSPSVKILENDLPNTMEADNGVNGENFCEVEIKPKEKRPTRSLSARDCIIDLIGLSNPGRYIVATQDPALKKALRRLPGVLVITLLGQTLALYRPSSASVRRHHEMEAKKMEAAQWEASILPSLQKEEGQENVKKKNRRGKNPLSCLPKKVKRVNQSDQEGKGTKEITKRVRTKRRRASSEPTKALDKNCDEACGVPPKKNRISTVHTNI